MAELAPGLLPMGFKTDLTRLLFASYVDNIYVAANFCEDALACLKMFFQYLTDCWGLELKPGSESLLVPPGADISKVPDPSKVVNVATVLGWRIRGDGSMSTHWSWLKRVMWAAFYCNVRCRGWAKLGLKRRLTLLSRSVQPVFQWGVSCWGPTPHFVDDLNSLQRNMVAKALNIIPTPFETPATFNKRRFKTASHYIENHLKWWGQMWMRSTIAWHEHVQRDVREQTEFYTTLSQDRCLSKLSWVAPLSVYHAAEWLDDRRTIETRRCSAGFPAFSSRTQTRVVRGHISMRWHDRVSYASRMCAS